MKFPYAIISVTGANATTYLQGQLACDVAKLADAQASFCAYCNVKGRVVATFYILRQSASEYLLLVPGDCGEHLLNTLAKYAKFSKVAVSISTQYYASLSTAPDVSAVYNIAIASDAYISLHTQEVVDQQPTVAWNYLFIQHKIPIIYQATTEKFLVHSLNLLALQAVSLSKGCFLGQEIIARVEYRGKSKYTLAQYSVAVPDIIPKPGDVLTLEQSLTVVDSAVDNSKLHILAIVKC